MLVEDLCWPETSVLRVRHRALGVVQAPPADRGGSGISPNGRSPFCGSSSSRSGPELEEPQKSEDLRPELAGGFVCLEKFAKTKKVSADRKFSDLGLDTTPAVGRGAGRPGKKGDFGCRRGPAGGFRRAIAPKSAQNALRSLSAGGTWSRRRCIKAETITLRKVRRRPDSQAHSAVFCGDRGY